MIRVDICVLALASLVPAATANVSLSPPIKFGGSGDDVCFAIEATDSAIYYTGVTNSTDFPVTDGSTYSGDPAGLGDIFVAKTDLDGTILWAKYLGGSGTDLANGLVLDDQGVLTVSGYTDSTDFPTLNPVQGTNGGKTDGVMVQLDTDGNLLFSSYYGGSEDDQFAAVTRESSTDSFAFVGFTNSVDLPFPTPNGTKADTIKSATSDSEGLVVVINRDRSLRVVTYFDRLSTSQTVILAATDGRAGEIFVTGRTNDSNFWNDLLFGGAGGTGGDEAFVSGIDINEGDRTRTRTFGGSQDDEGLAISYRPQENLVVFGGRTASDTDFPTQFVPRAGFDLPQASYGGGATDGFIGVVNFGSSFGDRPSLGALVYYGGSGADAVRAVRYDPNGFIQLAGVTGSADLPLEVNSPLELIPFTSTSYLGGASDGFVTVIDEARNFANTVDGLFFLGTSFDGGAGEDGYTAVDYNETQVPTSNFDPYFPVAMGVSASDPITTTASKKNPSPKDGGDPDKEISGGRHEAATFDPDGKISFSVMIEQSRTHRIGDKLEVEVKVENLGGTVIRSGTTGELTFPVNYTFSHAKSDRTIGPGASDQPDQSTSTKRVFALDDIQPRPNPNEAVIVYVFQIVGPPDSNAKISSKLNFDDNNPSNNSQEETYEVVEPQTPDITTELTFTKNPVLPEQLPDELYPAQEIDVQLKVKNVGAGDAENVQISFEYAPIFIQLLGESLPTGVTFVAENGDIFSKTRSFNLTSLAAGAELVLNFQMKSDSDLASFTETLISASATVPEDINAENNDSALDLFFTRHTIDVEVTTRTVPALALGDPATIFVTFRNLGEKTALGIRSLFGIPNLVDTFGTLTPPPGGEVNDLTELVDDTRTLELLLSKLGPGESAVFEIEIITSAAQENDFERFGSLPSYEGAFDDLNSENDGLTIEQSAEQLAYKLPSGGAFISGTVYLDRNDPTTENLGTLGPEDPPFDSESITVYLDENKNGEFNSGEPMGMTDRFGQYQFRVSNPPESPGANVEVRLIEPEVDVFQTLPDSTATRPSSAPREVILARNSSIPDVDFLLGVFRIEIEQLQNGKFRLTGSSPGADAIRIEYIEELQSPLWTQVDPGPDLDPRENHFTYEIDPAFLGSGKLFFQAAAARANSGSVSGRILRDDDANQTADFPPSGIAGVTAYVDLNGNGLLNATEPSAVSDSKGRFRITDIPPGVRTVRINANPSFEVTSSPDHIMISVLANQETLNVDFTGRHPGR